MNYKLIVCALSNLLWISSNQCTAAMSKTVLNDNYKGLVVEFSIPAEVHERDGKKYATVGSTVPIHKCTKEEIEERAKTTHHYADIFTDEVFAPLGELAYVRIDQNTAEKVFINRMKRILVTSSDGELATWRCAPTFESNNTYIAGTPIVNANGELMSVVTVKRGNYYAVSTLEGEGGYFSTPSAWKRVVLPAQHLAYGAHSFPSREALRQHVARLKATPAAPPAPATPVLVAGAVPRVTLVGADGVQLAHVFLPAVLVHDVEYL